MFSTIFSWNSIPFWPKTLFSISKTGRVILFSLYLCTQQPTYIFLALWDHHLPSENCIFQNFQFHFQVKQLWATIRYFNTISTAPIMYQIWDPLPPCWDGSPSFIRFWVLKSPLKSYSWPGLTGWMQGSKRVVNRFCCKCHWLNAIILKSQVKLPFC